MSAEIESLNITNDGDASGELYDNDENNETVDDRDSKKNEEAKENGKGSQGKYKNDKAPVAKDEDSADEQAGNYFFKSIYWKLLMDRKIARSSRI
jgi:hypothetical protein